MAGVVSVTTRSYDNCRTGANLQEQVLTHALVRRHGVRELGRLWFDGDARGSEGQPLVVADLQMGDGLRHDVVVNCTMANDVYVHDLSTFELLWARRIGNPVTNTQAMDYFDINDHWGILSTPVIDLETDTLFCVSMSSPTGHFNDAIHRLHAIRLSDGATLGELDLSETTYQPPYDLPQQSLGRVPRKQRAALALDSHEGTKTVFVGFGSFIEDASSNQGWLVAVDVSTETAPTIGAAITTSARYSGGGIWMGSQGPTIDPESGDIGLTIGNGAFDGVTDFGECVMRYAYVPKTQNAGEPGYLRVIGYFPAFTDTGRVYGAQHQTVADFSLIPNHTREAPSVSNKDEASDSDLNSGGRLDLPRELTGFDIDLTVVCGKDGIGYVLDSNAMGNAKLEDFAPDRIAQDVYKHALWIGWLTYYNPVTPTPTDLSQIPTEFANRTHHMHGTCVYYKSAIHGPMVFCWGENSNLRAWALNPDGSLVYLACSAEIASPQAPIPPGGMPGGMITLAANGQEAGTAMIYACVPAADANKTITAGRFLIYDAENFAQFSDGSGHIQVLWDSWNTGITYSHCKFAQATVSGGKILVPTYDGCVLVLG